MILTGIKSSGSVFCICLTQPKAHILPVMTLTFFSSMTFEKNLMPTALNDEKQINAFGQNDLTLLVRPAFSF